MESVEFMEKLLLNGKTFEALSVSLPHSTLLLIAGSRGVLGCGYFKIETADRVGEAFAIVSGVRSFEDMLAAKVIQVSAEAEKFGVKIGMTGAEALDKL